MESNECDRIRAEQSAIHRSHAFARAPQLTRFIDFLIDAAIEGREVSEYEIAVGPLRRRDSFDPAADAIVRKEARRLRDRLAQFYEDEGSAREWQLLIPPGSYTAVLRRRFRLHSKPVTRGTRIRIQFAGVAPAGFVDSTGWLSGVADDFLMALTATHAFEIVLPVERPADPAPEYRLQGTARYGTDSTFQLRLRLIDSASGRIEWRDESRHPGEAAVPAQFADIVKRLETWAVRQDPASANHAA